MDVFVRSASNDTLARRSYVMNCPPVGPPISTLMRVTGSKKEQTLDVPAPLDYMFDIPFTLTELSDIQQTGETCYVEVIIRTPSARITIAKSGEDKAPHWRLDGVFNLPRAQQQYTVAYEYTPKNDAAVIQRVKTDDRYTRVNFPSGTCRSVRYSETRHELGLDRVVEKTYVKIGDPTNPVRTDSVRMYYTGLGKVQTTTDQEGYKIGTVYDSWGRAIKVTNEDSTYTVTTYAYGTPLTLVGDNDQDFFGYCERVTSRVYAKDGSYVGGMPVQYYDVFGRLRRELRDSVNPAMGMTKYEYDVQNRLTTVVNPEGDTTRYWYDGYGRVKYKYQPDMGYISYAYDDLGQVRLTQSQQQHQEGKVTFTEYDDLGRVTLVGEARLGGEPGGGGHGQALTGGTPGEKREQTLSFPPHPTLNLNRFTDVVSGRVLNDNGVSTSVTANSTVWLPMVNMSYLSQFWTLNQLSQTTCIPQPITEPPVVPYLAHPVAQYNDPGLPQSTVNNFENISMFPQNARMAISYDALPPAVTVMPPVTRISYRKQRAIPIFAASEILPEELYGTC
jgi:YD repeat-containing protein